MPSEWLETLEQGAVEADLNMLSSTIAKIRKRDAALANALTRLIDNFEYDEILALIQKIRR